MNDLSLNRLKLTNFFGIYGTSEYDLSEIQGLIGFIGNNGSNKSNTLLALPFAFYGELPDENLRNLINTTALAEDPENCICEVVLSFSVGKDSYTVSRTISADEKMTSRLEINGKLVTRKRGEVDSKITALLGMDLSTAQLTIFSEQGKVDRFFSLSNPEKKEFIDNLISVSFNEHFDKLKKRVLFFEKRQLKLVNTLGVYSSQKKELDTSILSVQKQIEVLREKSTKFQGGPGRIQAIEVEITSYKDFESTKDKLDSTENQLADLLGVLITLENQTKEKERSLKSFTDSLSELKYAKPILVKHKKPQAVNTEQLDADSLEAVQISNTILKINQEVKTCNTNLTQVNSEIASLDKSLKEDICYVCHKPGIDLKEFNDKKSDLTIQKTKLESDLQGLSHQLAQETEKGQGLSIRIQELKDKKAQYDKDLLSYTTAREKRQSQVSSAKIYRNNKKNAKTSVVNAEADLAQHLNSYTQKKQELDPRITSLRDLITTYKGALGASPERYKELSSELEDLKLQAIEYDKVVLELSKCDTLLSKDLQTLEITRSRIDKITRIKAKIDSKLSDFPILKKHIETKFILFVQKSLARINRLTNEILKEISSPIEIRLILEETAKSSSVKCHFMKDQVEVPKISGGQRVVLGICFRIALWKYLSLVNPGNLSFMILDEVLVQLNADSANAAFNQIKSLKKYFKYIFMTSHTDHIWNVDHTFKFGE